MKHSDLELLYDVMVSLCQYTFRETKCRLRCFVDQKGMFALIARRKGATLRQITVFMGWRDHSSVVHAIRTMQGFVDVYPAFKKQYQKILEEYEFREAAGVLDQADF